MENSLRKIWSSLVTVFVFGAGVVVLLTPGAPSARAATFTGTFYFQVDGANAAVTGCDNCNGMDVVIPSDDGNGHPVTSIRIFSFFNRGLTSVVIPSTVTSIGENAFSNNSLTSIVIPSSVTTLGGEAFASNQLSSLSLSSNLTTMGILAFGNNRLTSVVIPPSLTSTGNRVFEGNPDLASVILPSTLTSIGDRAFWGGVLTSVSIPSSVTSIGEGAFSNNRLSSITLPPTLTRIEVNAFSSNRLTSVSIPPNVTAIGDYAFMNNRLTSVSIPRNVTAIGASAFMNNQLPSVSIPSSVTSIGESAFAGNQLTSVTIPSAVTSIGNSAFATNALSNVVIPSSVTTLGSSIFADNVLLSFRFEGNRPSIASWGSIVWSLQCITYPAGASGWPGTALNGLTPTVAGECTSSRSSGPSAGSPTTTVPAQSSVVTPSPRLWASFGALTARTIAKSAGLRVPGDAKVSMQVVAKSTTVCRISNSIVQLLKAGKCTVEVTVTHKPGWKSKKRVSLIVLNGL